MKTCRICGAQGCDCEEVIQAQVLKITERFGRIRRAVAKMDSRDLMRGVKRVGQMGQSGQRLCQ